MASASATRAPGSSKIDVDPAVEEAPTAPSSSARWSANRCAAAAIAALNPIVSEVQPLRNAHREPKAARMYTYSPPERGIAAPSSAYAKVPSRAKSAPKAHRIRIQDGLPRSRAMNPEVPKMPVPIMFDTSRQAAVNAVTRPTRGFGD
jgi:hypothetical protein